jgi:hypothetical protein
MEKLNRKDPQAIARIKEVIDRISAEWMSQPNIIDIVPALRTKAGRVLVEKLTIGFHVTEKVAPELLADRGYKPIPSEIEGIPTDVILVRRPALGSVDCKDTRSQMFDTLVGGIAIGNANMNVYGTLGMTLLAESDGRMVGITNEHVLVYDGDGHAGDEVQQPRYFLESEVSLDSADCCPNGQLHYRGVDNPIIDAAAGVCAAAALAAALSDEIDPHRRGQAATVPDPDERTTREVVSVALNYPEIPFPGRPFKVSTDWIYRRHTDRRVLEFAVSETKQNERVIDYQQLITDKREYERGDTVTFLAILGSEEGELLCHNYFVTAAALSQSHRRAYKIILRPCELPTAVVGKAEAPSLTYGHDAHVVKDQTARRCYDFSSQKPHQFQKQEVIAGITYDPRGLTAAFVKHGGTMALRWPARGLVVRFHLPVQRVLAQVVLNAKEQVTMTAYSGTSAVGSASTTSHGPSVLDISASSIEYVVFRGGMNEALLLGICTEVNLGHFCLYMGKLQLASDEELGPWKTFLFAQTRNDVPLGIDPTVAAQTIGGWPVTDNFMSTGDSESLAYGHQCNVDIVPNGDFRVV